MQLDDVKLIDRDEANKAFSSGEAKSICNALLRITYHDTDWLWVQDKCILFLDHNNSDVQGLAAACLGHIARIHHTLDVDKVIPLLKNLSNDPVIGGRIEDALDDINMFVE